MSPWQLRPVQYDAVERLVAALEVHPVTARCMVGRGLVDEALATDFLSPRLARLRPPRGLVDLEVAVERLVRAARAGEKIGVFGDYDVDGITTCALLTCFLRQVGLPCEPRVARRDAGYGFGLADVAHFAEAGCTLIITGDCGTSDVAAIAHARSLGIDAIVIDHHTVPATDAVHPALALINPLRADSSFPFTGMASVGLSFYVAAATRTALRELGFFTSDRPDPDVRDLLDLVAVGTICDLVPLVDENRILTFAGLRELSLRKRYGLAALLDCAGLGADVAIDERAVGWKISPRVNAPGRLGDAAPALSLLLSRDRAEADRWAAELEQANAQRREVQDHVLTDAIAAADADNGGAALIVAGEGWPSGVVGIVAAKLVERYGKPAFVIAIDPTSGQGRGSARAVPGVNLYNALHTCRDRLVRYGGHAGAAGLTVARDDVPSLRASLNTAIAEQLTTDTTDLTDPIDAEVCLADVDERLARELAALAPFGKGNDEPILLCRGLRVRESRRVGGGAHLKLKLSDDSGAQCGAIAFGMGEADPGQDALIDVAFAPSVDEWQGQTRVELTIRALKATPTV